MTTTQSLLVELGCEELPPESLQALGKAFATGLHQGLKQAGLLNSAATQSQPPLWATPRRLAVSIPEVMGRQPDREMERQGPPERAAVKDGEPTKVGLGFARSLGIEFSQVGRKETPRGPVLFHSWTEPGQSLEQVLNQVLKETIAKLPIAKRMRWGDSLHEFVRPVHWLVALHGPEVIPCTALGLTGDRTSSGHRFLGEQQLTIADASAYESQLYEQGKVVVDFSKRRQLVREQITSVCPEGSKPDWDEDLLDTVTAIVEWPSAYCGQFSQEFLKVPSECLISSMKEHQKVFPVLDKEGKLSPHFLFAAGTVSTDPQQVIAGNERVIAPRLADAAFFYQQDLKSSLDDLNKQLAKATFQAQLGSILNKSQRIEALVAYMAEELQIASTAAEAAATAARYCKADLASAMVFEFPELQGIMGGYYAASKGLGDSVAAAIRSHYQPSFAGEEIPGSLEGQLVALADKIDTIVGIFGIGKPPTGSKDPYSLRRSALGVLRIITEAKLNLALTPLLSRAVELHGGNLTNSEALSQSRSFVMERFPAKYKEDGLAVDSVQAVAGLGIDAPLDFHRRVTAVDGFKRLQEAPVLAEANKRVRNILKNQEGIHIQNPAQVTTDLLVLPEEKQLAESLASSSSKAADFAANGDYENALKALVDLHTPISTFFDNVRVMDDDQQTKANRIQLCVAILQAFMSVADISALQISE